MYMYVGPRMELHLFGLLGHIHRSALVHLATVGLGTSSVTHNAPAAQDWQKKKRKKVWEIR